MIELYIENKGIIYAPIVEDGVTYQLERVGVPSCLKFNVLKDNEIDFQEGNPVILKYNGENIFYGFVFKKERDKEHNINVTAYDQMRYLKNQDTIAYDDMTANEIISKLASGFGLQTGELSDTAYKIPYRVEDNKTLFDMILTAIDLTLQNTGEMFVLYDDFGKLTLKNISSMILPILIDENNAENFNYCTSIDENTYNKIRLVYSDSESGIDEVYESEDTEKQEEWGILQYFDTLEEGENAEAKVSALLSLYNKKTRSLSIKNVFGDVRVRGGSVVIVRLDLGDVITDNLMIVDKVNHSFKADEYLMDLEMICPNY